MSEHFPQESDSSIEPDDNEDQPVPRYFSARLYGGMAAGMAVIGGIETGVGLPEAVADGTFVLSGAMVVSAIAALVAERVMSRNQ